jgi:outer membrane protein insertion porin family
LLLAGLALIPSSLLAQVPPEVPGEAATESPAEDLESEPLLEVRSVRFVGLNRVPEETLQVATGLKSGMKVTELQLADLAQRSVKAVFATTYFTDVRVFSKRDGDQLDLTVLAVEKYVVRSVEIEGFDEIEEEDIRKALTVKAGRFLDVTDLAASLRAVEQLYQEKGFYLAEVSYDVLKEEESRTAVVTFTIKEQAEVQIRKIFFAGNRRLKEAELRKVLRTGEKNYISFLQESVLAIGYFFQSERGLAGAGAMADLDAAQFETWSSNEEVDLELLKFFYGTKGYIEVRHGQPRMALMPDNKGVIITIDVQEGDRYDFGPIDVMTDDKDGFLIDKKKLMKGLKSKEGKLFNLQFVLEDIQKLTAQYQNRGYAFVTISHVPQKPEGTTRIMGLTYLVQKGNPSYIANIEVAGNETTADKVLRREMKIAEGDLFNIDKIDRSKALIYRLGYFEEVDITFKPSEASPLALKGVPGRNDVDFVDLVITVKERDTGQFQIGAGFSSMESYLLQASIQKENFLGRGHRLGISALLSAIRKMFTLSFAEPRLLDSPVGLSIELYDMEYDYPVFTRKSIGGVLRLGVRFHDFWSTSLTYTAEKMETELGGREGFSGMQLERLQASGWLTSLTLGLAFDTRNNVLMPTKGTYNYASIEWATPYLGGETDFYRITAFSRFYIPLFWQLVLRLNATIGYIGSTSDKGVPIFERYYVGGIQTVRGFENLSLSPTIPAAASKDPASDLIDFPLGGNKQLIFNVELEIPIYKPMNITGVVFFDAGNAFAENENLSLVDLRLAAGFGIRWWSPMGPLRFEWGFPLDRREGEDKMVFQFTIGTSF